MKRPWSSSMPLLSKDSCVLLCAFFFQTPTGGNRGTSILIEPHQERERVSFLLSLSCGCWCCRLCAVGLIEGSAESLCELEGIGMCPEVQEEEKR